MRIARIDQLLTIGQEHLESTRTYGTAIETLLTYGLVVRIYAEFEQQILAAIGEKSDFSATAELRAAFDARIKDHYRGIRFRNLSELFAALGEPYRAVWAARRAGNSRAVTFYGFIVAQRHEIAHSGAAIANFRAEFRDVRAWYESGHIVLDFFRETLFAIDPAHLPV